MVGLCLCLYLLYSPVYCLFVCDFVSVLHFNLFMSESCQFITFPLSFWAYQKTYAANSHAHHSCVGKHGKFTLPVISFAWDI